MCIIVNIYLFSKEDFIPILELGIVFFFFNNANRAWNENISIGPEIEYC